MWELLASNADTLIAGALAAFGGALGGALGAQIIANRYQTKRSVVEELNCVGAAHAFCFAFCNRLLGLKEQHVKPMHDKFAEVKARRQRHKESLQGPDRPAFHIEVDLQTLTPPKLSVEALERLVFEKVRIRGRGLKAAIDFVDTFDGLEKLITYRNALIVEIQRAAPPLSEKELAERYLGLRTEWGADERFSSTVNGIFDYTDHCIFFLRTLADDLLVYDRKLRGRYGRRCYWLRVPKLKPADWSLAEEKNLIPPTEQYQDWLRGFRKAPTRLERARSWLGSIFSKQ